MYQVSPMNWLIIFLMVLYLFFYLSFFVLNHEKNLSFNKLMKKIYVK